jgi:hypothetical protein
MLRGGKYYIGIPEGSIGTITHDTPEDIAGFFTTDQQTCLSIYAYGKGSEKGRLTMCHINGRLDDKIIRELFEWAKPSNSERTILITETVPPPLLEIANNDSEAKRMVLKDRVSGEVANMLINRKYKFFAYHKEVIGGFNEVSFTLDRDGKYTDIDKYNLPTNNPYQHPLDYLNRMIINSILTTFTLNRTAEMDLVFDGKSVIPHKPYPRKWTDAIDDCCDIEDDVFFFNVGRFNAIRAVNSEWFRGSENKTFIISMWLRESATRYRDTPATGTTFDEFLERVPKFRYAIKKGMTISVKMN